MSSWNVSSFSTPRNREKKQIAKHKVYFAIKIHHYVGLVCETNRKSLLSDPETSLTTLRLLSLRRWRRLYGN